MGRISTVCLQACIRLCASALRIHLAHSPFYGNVSGHYAKITPDEKKGLENQGLLSLCWCPEGDSNSHFFRKRILNPPRLPIPPSGLNGGEV